MKLSKKFITLAYFLEKRLFEKAATIIKSFHEMFVVGKVDECICMHLVFINILVSLIKFQKLFSIFRKIHGKKLVSLFRRLTGLTSCIIIAFFVFSNSLATNTQLSSKLSHSTGKRK